MNKNRYVVGTVGTVEFWVPDEELKNLREAKDHYFAFGWDSKQEEYILYIDGERAKAPTAPGRDMRLSSVKRSPAWVKATYLSTLDKLSSFGKEEVRHENE